MPKIRVEIGLVRRLDAALRLMRIARLAREFREPALVRRIEPEKVVFVKVRHSQGQLKKSLPRLAHFGDEAPRRSPLHVIYLRALLFERRRIGPPALAMVEHFTHSLHRFEEFAGPLGHGSAKPIPAQAQPGVPAASRK